MATSVSVNAKIARLIHNAELQDRVINGSDTTDVQTDGGLVPSLAKTMRLLGEQSASVSDEFLQALETTVNARADTTLDAMDERINTSADLILTDLDERVNVAADGILADALAAKLAAETKATEAAASEVAAETAADLAANSSTSASSSASTATTAKVAAEAAAVDAAESAAIYDEVQEAFVQQATATADAQAQLLTGLSASAKTAELAAAATVPLMAFTAAEAQGIFDNSLPMQGYAALRAYTGRATGVRLTSAGIAGAFQRDAGDTTSVDNGGTVIVDASGRRWKRMYSGAMSVKWFSAKGDGATDDTTSIIAALLAAAGRELVFDPGTYIADGTLLRVYAGTTLRGYGATIKLKAGTYSTTRYFFGTNTGITYDSGYAETAYVDIAGFVLDGNIANVTTTDSCYGINAYRTRSFFVSDVTIKDLPGVIGGGYGIAFSFSTDVLARRVNINRTDRQNIVVWETKNARIEASTLKDSYFRDCILVSSNTPAVFQSSECHISNTECRNTMPTGTHVIRFSGESSGKMSDLRLYGYQSGAAGLHGIYITDTYPKRITVSNVSINDCFRGVEVATDAAHVLEFTGLQIGAETPCYDGFRANSSGSVVKINGGTIKASNQPLYINAADFQSVNSVELIGGASNSAIFSKSTGTTVFSNNTIRGNTNASYPILFAGSGEPILTGNKSYGNTVAAMRCTTGAIASGNSPITIDGVAKSGTPAKRGTTASRPAFASTDIMAPYMDTTLAAAGKPIWWTGTAWVDATGVAV